jgi:hypothetical protein
MKVPVIDIGGTNVKVLATGKKELHDMSKLLESELKLLAGCRWPA